MMRRIGLFLAIDAAGLLLLLIFVASVELDRLVIVALGLTFGSVWHGLAWEASRILADG